MSPNTTDSARGKASTDALPSSRGRRRKLITALMILAFLAIIAIALYALSLIAGAVIRLSHSIWSALPVRVLRDKGSDGRGHAAQMKGASVVLGSVISVGHTLE